MREGISQNVLDVGTLEFETDTTFPVIILDPGANGVKWLFAPGCMISPFANIRGQISPNQKKINFAENRKLIITGLGVYFLLFHHISLRTCDG